MDMGLTERLGALFVIVLLVGGIIGYHWLMGRRTRRKAAGAPGGTNPGSGRDQSR